MLMVCGAAMYKNSLLFKRRWLSRAINNVCLHRFCGVKPCCVGSYCCCPEGQYCFPISDDPVPTKLNFLSWLLLLPSWVCVDLKAFYGLLSGQNWDWVCNFWLIMGVDAYCYLNLSMASKPAPVWNLCRTSYRKSPCALLSRQNWATIAEIWLMVKGRRLRNRELQSVLL